MKEILLKLIESKDLLLLIISACVAYSIHSATPFCLGCLIYFLIRILDSSNKND